MVRKWSGLLFCTGLISPEFELLYSIKSQSRDRLLREVILWLGTPSSPCLGWRRYAEFSYFFSHQITVLQGISQGSKVTELRSYHIRYPTGNPGLVKVHLTSQSNGDATLELTTYGIRRTNDVCLNFWRSDLQAFGIVVWFGLSPWSVRFLFQEKPEMK